MKYKLKVFEIWEYGSRKDAAGNPHQEDSIYPAFGNATGDDRTFILCDGMGGHDAGEVASATVCEAMSSSILNDGHDPKGIFTDSDFAEALDDAFDALDARDSGAEKKMGTTMTFLKLHNEGAFIAHIGDSRVYHIRPGKDGEDTRILFQTEDHSLINDLIRIGELTHEEARQSKQKNVITRAMQPNMERRPKADIYKTADIRPGDYFYMCSDGMLEQPDMENGNTLRNIFSEMGGSDEEKVNILTRVTEDNRDNHTAIIVHVLDVKETAAAPIKNFAIVDDDDNSSPAPMPAPAPEKPQKKTNVNRIAWIVLLVCMCVAALICMKACPTVLNHNREDVVNEKEKDGSDKSERTDDKQITRPAEESAPAMPAEAEPAVEHAEKRNVSAETAGETTGEAAGSSADNEEQPEAPTNQSDKGEEEAPIQI